MLQSLKSNQVGTIVQRPSDKKLAIINVLTTEDPQPCESQHLYAVSDEKPKQNDWILRKNHPNPIIMGDDLICEGDKKIVVTTNKDLKIEKYKNGVFKDLKYIFPTFNDSFIKAYIDAYNAGKPITEIDLEMEYNSYSTKENAEITADYKIKIRQDNTVIVHQSKLYSREDIKKLLTKKPRRRSLNPPPASYIKPVKLSVPF